MISKQFLEISINRLKITPTSEPFFWSWCSWTTYTRLENDAGYWTAPLPLPNELLDNSTLDGGMWTQPFYYDDIAHIIIPRIFTFQRMIDGEVHSFERKQDIVGVSSDLKLIGIPHHLSQYAVEAKTY